MRHEEIRERLHEYRDGELTGALAAEIGAHLPDCAACRGVLEGWDRLAASLLKAAPAPDESFVGRVMARIAEEETAPAPSGRGWWLAPAFAAAAVLGALAWPGAAPSAEDLLLSDRGTWLFQSQPAQADDVLTVAMEGPP